MMRKEGLACLVGSQRRTRRFLRQQSFPTASCAVLKHGGHMDANPPLGNYPAPPSREHWLRRVLLPFSIALSIGSFLACPSGRYADSDDNPLLYGLLLCFFLSTPLAVLLLYSRWRKSRKDDSWFLVLLSATLTILAIFVGAILALVVLALLWNTLKHRTSH
jgi:hypothetical protein